MNKANSGIERTQDRAPRPDAMREIALPPRADRMTFMKFHHRAALAALLALAAAQAALGDSTIGMKEKPDTIPKDLDCGGGLVAKKGKVTTWVPDGLDQYFNSPKLASFTLAKDVTLGNGIPVKADTAISFYPSGKLRSFFPAREFTYPKALAAGGSPIDVVMPGGREIRLYESGSLADFTSKLEIDLKPVPIRIKAMSPIGLYESGMLRALTTVDDLPLPGMKIAARAGTEVGFTGSGSLCRFILAAPGYELANGMAIPAGAKVEFFPETAKVFHCEIAGTWKTKAGALVKGNVYLDADGNIESGILAANRRVPGGPLFEAGYEASFDASGEATSGILMESWKGYEEGKVFNILWKEEDPEE
jgi:hypothetical protein